MGESRKLVLIPFLYHGCFFPIRFPPYGILQHMGNTWVLPLISHGTGKCNKTHCIGRNWEIGTHTFPIVWMFFPHQTIFWYTSSYGKCMCFLINFPQHRKKQQNLSNGESLRNWFPQSFHSIGAFSPLDFHPIVYFIIW